MTIARCRQVSVEATPYYHVIGRCVRRALLCGLDQHTGADYSHRRDWITERLELLGRIFAVDLCAYAIMNNHFHLVVRLRPEMAAAWSNEDILDRWKLLYGIPDPIRVGLRGDASEEQRSLALELVQIRRGRLCDLSWFMKCLNEYIARRANAEDHCTGAFWEGRYKSQALLDEKALISCMAYVDLNPVRAGIAKRLSDSDYTAIQQRIRGVQGELPSNLKLSPFADESCSNSALPFYFRDYVELVDWTGRAVILGKRGSIPKNVQGILEQLGFDETSWRQSIRLMGKRQLAAYGASTRLFAAAQTMNRHWFRGSKDCLPAFGA